MVQFVYSSEATDDYEIKLQEQAARDRAANAAKTLADSALANSGLRLTPQQIERAVATTVQSAADRVTGSANNRALAGKTGPSEDTKESRTDSQKIVKRSLVESPDSPLPNPLDSYVNYTYNLSLHAVPINKYNRIVNDNYDYTTADNTVLIAGGGRNNDAFSRHPRFSNTDFYFDSFKMRTVIGMNAQTRGSNVIEIEFVIIEPIGMTFLERMIDVAAGYKVFSWDQLPLVLQIDFFANADASDNMYKTGLIDDQTKRIVIKLISCKIKVDARGTSYVITAVPVSQTAFMQNTATTPAIFEVLSTTVGEFFDSQRSAEEVTLAALGEDRRVSSAGAGEFGHEKKKYFRVGSYTAAINQYQKRLEEADLQDYADTYVFKLDDQIAKSKIIFNEKTNSVNSVPMTNTNSPSVNVNINQELVRINAGTTLLDVINQVLRNSQYFADIIQQKPELKNANPIGLFKVVPVIEFDEGKWDFKRMQFARRIIIYIKSYDYHNTKFRYANQSLPERWHKEYNYLYTGKNQQILDLSIDFNSMFYVAMTERPTKFARSIVQNQEETNQDQKDQTDQSYDRANSIQYVREQPKVTNAEVLSIQGSADDSRSVRSNDFYKSVFGSATGDMINIKMRIAGDPHMIKQDEVFFTPNDSQANQVLNRYNSINMDVTEIYCYLRFVVPEDYDSDGMINFGVDRNFNTFNGIYRIMNVENNFSRGEFTQELQLIKLFGQTDDKSRSAAKPNRNREKPESAVTVAAGTSSQSSGQNRGTVAAQRLSAQAESVFQEWNSGVSSPTGRLKKGASALPGYASTQTQSTQTQTTSANETPDNKTQVEPPSPADRVKGRVPPGLRSITNKSVVSDAPTVFGSRRR